MLLKSLLLLCALSFASVPDTVVLDTFPSNRCHVDGKFAKLAIPEATILKVVILNDAWAYLILTDLRSQSSRTIEVLGRYEDTPEGADYKDAFMVREGRDVDEYGGTSYDTTTVFYSQGDWLQVAEFGEPRVGVQYLKTVPTPKELKEFARPKDFGAYYCDAYLK
jgi:hypothetical protein